IWVLRDMTTPTISITSPTNDSLTDQTSITVDWSGSDAGTGIDYYEVFLNEGSQGTTTSLSMGVSLSADGYHNITVVAYDNAGNSNQDTIWVLRDMTTPTISITSPTNDSLTDQTSITVDWSGSDAGSGIAYYEVLVNGTSQGTTTSLSLVVALGADGYHNITVVVHDLATNTNYDMIWVQRDTVDPTISITSPASDTLTDQTSITVDWSGSDAGSGIAYYEVLVNGTSQGTTTGLSMSVNLSADGYYNITVVAYDNAGNNNQDTIWVLRDTVGSTTTITSPTTTSSSTTSGISTGDGILPQFLPLLIVGLVVMLGGGGAYFLILRSRSGRPSGPMSPTPEPPPPSPPTSATPAQMFELQPTAQKPVPIDVAPIEEPLQENKCIICQLVIKEGTNILCCPFCGVKGHSGHFKEWLRTKAVCPNCKHELREDQLLAGIVKETEAPKVLERECWACQYLMDLKQAVCPNCGMEQICLLCMDHIAHSDKRMICPDCKMPLHERCMHRLEDGHCPNPSCSYVFKEF
ncbi:MAG: Ig-like domain-containing protein, partial [Candidatus Hermodarchaeota archaeon]